MSCQLIETYEAYCTIEEIKGEGGAKELTVINTRENINLLLTETYERSFYIFQIGM